MSLPSIETTADEGVNAAFVRNNRNEVCITFSDPSFVRSDTIWLDSDELAIHAFLEGKSVLIGYVSEGMAGAFADNDNALLTALRPDGTIFELFAPIRKY